MACCTIRVVWINIRCLYNNRGNDQTWTVSVTAVLNANPSKNPALDSAYAFNWFAMSDANLTWLAVVPKHCIFAVTWSVIIKHSSTSLVQQHVWDIVIISGNIENLRPSNIRIALLYVLYGDRVDSFYNLCDFNFLCR
jgi:hypothetical protein